MQKTILVKTLLFTSLFVFMLIYGQAQNVGIGTNTPSEKLQVIGNIKADTSIAVATDLALPYRKTQPTAGSPLVQISNTNTAGGTAMYILANSSGAATAIRGESTTGTGGRFVTTSGTAATFSSANGTAGNFSSTTGKALVTDGIIKLTGIGEINKAVLTSDANGYATWSSPCFYKASGFLVDHHVVAGSTYILADWKTENINTNNNAVLDNGNGKLFVLKAGLYRVSVNVAYFTKNSTVNEYINFTIKKNNIAIAESFTSKTPSANYFYNGQLTLTTIVELAAQDYISFVLENGFYLSSNTTDVVLTSPSIRNYFTVEKID